MDERELDDEAATAAVVAAVIPDVAAHRVDQPAHDRQTKATFASLADAEKAGRDIKKAHPIVQVSVYDAQEGEQTLLE